MRAGGADRRLSLESQRSEDGTTVYSISKDIATVYSEDIPAVYSDDIPMVYSDDDIPTVYSISIQLAEEDETVEEGGHGTTECIGDKGQFLGLEIHGTTTRLRSSFSKESESTLVS